MKNTGMMVMVVAALVTLTASCGGPERSGVAEGMAVYLPERLGAHGLSRTSAVRVFIGDSLYEYINGGAEMYHQYGFVEVATASYRVDESELVADLYRFGDPDHAYGMYSMLRPEDPLLMPLGVEGFTSGPTVVFVKGPYLVNVVGYDESAPMVAAVQGAAEALAAAVPGTTEYPTMFSLFPTDGQLTATGKVYTEAFLGLAALRDFYTSDYVLDSDLVTLFVSSDPTGEKYAGWSLQPGLEKAALPSPPSCWDKGFGMVVQNDYYGLIAGGLKAGKFAGMVGYDVTRRKFLEAWVRSLNADSLAAAH